jgi:site-specific DNA-methyltransferase (adenine-specific)
MEFRNIDGLELLKTLPDNSIDFILTDPPYELEIHGGGAGFMKDRKLLNKHISYIGYGFDFDTYFSEYERVLKVMNAVIFCSNNQVSKTMNWFENKGYSVTLLVWKKPNPIPLGNGKYIGDTEFMIYVRGKGATFNNIGYKDQLRVFEYNVPSTSERIHPTEKPIDMLRRLLLIHTNENDVVLDTFAGSFTTGLACHKENRKCIASEIDEKMFMSANTRFKNEISQTQLF